MGTLQPWPQEMFEKNSTIRGLMDLFQELAKEMKLEAVKQYRVNRLVKVEYTVTIQKLKNDSTKTISNHK